MFISRLAMVSATALLAVLPGQTQAATPPVNVNASTARSPLDVLSRSLMQPQHQPVPAKRQKCPRNAYIFASEIQSDDLYEYCEDGPDDRLPFHIYKGIAGWGLAVSPNQLGPGVPAQRLAVGTNNGHVNVYRVQANGLLAAGPVTLTLSNQGSQQKRGQALGICFDGSQGLYASNWSFPDIDYFSAAQVNGSVGGGPPNKKWFTFTGTSTTFTPFYLACDYDKPHSKSENIVMVDGIDAGTGNVEFGSFNAGLVTVLPGQTIGPSSVNYPGGLALDVNDDLVYSDWTAGMLYSFGPPDVWNTVTGACAVPGFPSNGAYLPVTFDEKQVELWVGNTFTPMSPGPATSAYSVEFPLSGSGCHPSGESGGFRTRLIPNGEFAGIAVWPNGGV